jgi:PAS domain S-box-containing protein
MRLWVLCLSVIGTLESVKVVIVAALVQIIFVVYLLYNRAERRRAMREVWDSEKRFRMLFENSKDGILIADDEGRFLSVNQSACDLLGSSRERLLQMKVTDLEATHPPGAAAPYHSHLRTGYASGEFSFLRGGWQHRTVEYTASRIVPGRNLSILHDVTEAKEAEEYLRLSRERFFTEHRKAEMALEQLTARLLQLQDEERRRIARELHDVTAQNMLAIVTNLSRLKQGRFLPSEFDEILTVCYKLGKESLKDIRTFSYLLHPPMLDESGLVDALQWYVDGFISRSGIYVDLVMSPKIERLPSEVEIALFRVVQEGLTNIHRHSGSDTASIRLEREPKQLVLEITDSGHGMPGSARSTEKDETLVLGVGIPGMRQRIRQLGGALEIKSSERGTTVKVTLPLADTRESFMHTIEDVQKR